MSIEQRIGTRRLRARMAEVLNRVGGAGTPYVVERAGEPVAAVVPLELYRKLVPAGVAESDTTRPNKELREGPYAALLALAGTMHSKHSDIARHKHRHLARIFAGRRRRS